MTTVTPDLGLAADDHLVPRAGENWGRLFPDGTITAAFKLTENTVTSKGDIMVNYERPDAVPTGNL